MNAFEFLRGNPSSVITIVLEILHWNIRENMAEANFRLNLDWFDSETEEIRSIGIDDAEDLESLPPTQPYGCTEHGHGIDLDSLNFENIEIIIEESMEQDDNEESEAFKELEDATIYWRDHAYVDPDWEGPNSDSDMDEMPARSSFNRFQAMTTAQLERFRNDQRNKETTRKTRNHLKTLYAFMHSKGCTSTLENVQPEELDKLLGEFMICVRKEKPDQDGSIEYEPSTLRGMLGSYERHLKEMHYGHSLISSPLFHYTREMLKSKSKDLKKKGKGNKSSKSSGMTDDEIEKLWSSGALGDSNPRSLVHTVWWNNTMHFGMRGVKENYNLCWGDITEKVSTDGRAYLEHNERQTKMRSGAIPDTKACPSQMWEIPSSPKCPVALFRCYKSKCPDVCISPDKPLYLQYKEYKDVNILQTDKTWLKKQRYGERTLSQFMKRIVSDGDLTSDKKLTNTSARKVMVQRLIKANVPPTDIMQKSGHKRVESILNYGQLQETQQEAMSHILTGSSSSASFPTMNYSAIQQNIRSNQTINNNNMVHPSYHPGNYSNANHIGPRYIYKVIVIERNKSIFMSQDIIF